MKYLNKQQMKTYSSATPMNDLWDLWSDLSDNL